MSARSFLAFLAVLAVIGLLGFGLLSKGGAEDRRGRPGAGPGAADAAAARARARSPTTAGAGCWSTSGRPGAAPAVRRRRRWSASSAATGTRTSPCSASTSRTTATTRSPSSRVPDQLPAAAIGRRRAQRSLRLDRRPGELPGRSAGAPGADLARPGRRPLPARERRTAITEGSVRVAMRRSVVLAAAALVLLPGLAPAAQPATHRRRRRRGDVPDLRHAARALRLPAGGATERP